MDSTFMFDIFDLVAGDVGGCCDWGLDLCC